MRRCEMESAGSGCGPVGDFFEHGDKPSHFITGKNALTPEYRIYPNTEGEYFPVFRIW